MAQVMTSHNAQRSVLQQELSTISVLVRRDLTRFVREKSRVAGAVLQPLIFWAVLGSGMSSTFVLPGEKGVGYQQYFFPGVVVMVALFTAIFTTMSVIEDRHSGFLQAVLVAPGSRASVVIGKAVGASIVAFVQGLMFVALAPLAGYAYGAIDFPMLLLALGLACFALCTLGFAVAWWLDSTAGYHVVMSLLLLPMWIMSGAMFPSIGSRTLAIVQQLDPMSYAVSAVRRAMYSGALPQGTGLPVSAAFELLVLLAFASVSLVAALQLCHRRR